MQISNKTKKNIISRQVIPAYSFMSRLKGLMFSNPADMILISPREDTVSATIHMMFMRFPIDVIWTNSSNQVVDIKRNVPPFNLLNPTTWKTYKPCNPAKHIIELGIGNVGDTKIGDCLEFL